MKGPNKRGPIRGEKIMKTTLLAAAAALSLGGSAAYADGDQGTIPNTFFTELPGVVAQAPGQNVPWTAGDRTRQQGQTYSQATHGPWLFPPIGKYLEQKPGG
jgi:hypothetical protein